MEDIAPGLLEKIQKEFRENYESDEEIKKLLQELREHLAKHPEAYDYAGKVGSILADAFSKNLSSAVLPDGKMWYNIGNRIIPPALKEIYQYISDYVSEVQAQLNTAAGIGIKPVIAPMNKDRAKGIVDRLSGEEDFDKAAWILAEPIKTIARSIVDDSIQANAEFHGKAGMKPKIIRKSSGKCCEWCNRIAGTYHYPDVPKDVYRRHERCKCTVEYDPGNGKRQNVHTKQWKSEEEIYALRRNIGLEKKEQSFEEKLLEKGYANNDIDRIGTNEVNMSYIYSEQYKQKFNHISDNENLNAALHRGAVALLNEHKNSDTEGVYIFNAKNGKTVLKKTGEKNTLGVGLRDKDLRIIRNQSDIVGMHNHPTNLMPNGSDFVAAGYRGYDFGIVVTHDGRVFKYSVGEKVFQPQTLDRRIDKYKNMIYNSNIEDAYVRALNEYRKEYGISWQEIE